MKEAILADIRAMAAHLSSEKVMKNLEENRTKQRNLQEKQLKSIENQLEKLKNAKKWPMTSILTVKCPKANMMNTCCE
ncbi:hypothetical protein [Cohnella laeviribosi]|uniref:hypothetical protein n=1 Tax=Cohnella laeviribosi TaxID=380174 RepID=UPI003D21770E